MSGKLQFDYDAGGFFPKLHKAACEGGRGVIDQTATRSDRTLLEVSAQGAVMRPYLGACPGVMGVPEPPPEPPEGEEPAPWASLRTHAELNAWAEEQDLATIPEEWFALTVEAKKAWLEENVSW